MKLKFKKIIKIIFVCFSLFLISCEKDDTISTSQTETGNNLISKKVTLNHVLSKISNPKIREKLIHENLKNNYSTKNNSINRLVDTDSIFTMIENNGTIYFLLPLNSYTTEKPYFLKLVINITQNEESFGFLKYLPTNPISSLDLRTFSGVMQILDIDKNIRALSTFVNGIPLETNQTNANLRISCYDVIRIVPVRCGEGGNHSPGQTCDDGVVRGHYEISVQTVCNGSGSDPYLTQIIEDSDYNPSGGGAGGSIDEVLSNILSSEELNWWNNATNEEKQPILDYINPNVNNGNSWLVTREAIKTIKDGGEVDFENKIMIDSTFKNNQKAMCIYNKMRTIDGFNKALAPFEVENPNAFIKLKTENLPNSVRAETKEPNENNVIEIIINDCPSCENGINSQPNLLIAQTIIHEVLHAEFFRQIIEAINIGSYIHDYDTIVNALKNSKYNKLSEYIRTTKDWSHNYMARYFRNAIAIVTQEFDTGIAVAQNQFPGQLYTNLAWRGLMVYENPVTGYGVVAWMELVGPDINNPSQASINVQNTINNYLLNNSNQACQN